MAYLGIYLLEYALEVLVCFKLRMIPERTFNIVAVDLNKPLVSDNNHIFSVCL